MVGFCFNPVLMSLGLYTKSGFRRLKNVSTRPSEPRLRSLIQVCTPWSSSRLPSPSHPSEATVRALEPISFPKVLPAPEEKQRKPQRYSYGVGFVTLARGLMAFYKALEGSCSVSCPAYTTGSAPSFVQPGPAPFMFSVCCSQTPFLTSTKIEIALSLPSGPPRPGNEII